MSREELDLLYELLDKFYYGEYVKTEEEEDQIINVQDMVGEKLKVSDCWNIKKAG